MGQFWVYILTNPRHNVLYTGFTDDIERRVGEHKAKVHSGFTKTYNCKILVYYEEFGDADEALARERQIKRYRREWKKNLINGMNPAWRDLFEDFQTS
jgi:putative endonuclease